MRILIDTCIVIFMTFERDRLSRDVLLLLDDYDNQLYVSMDTVKELHTYARLTINEAQGHNDPSDQIIIAHAITERLPLISSDHKFDFYMSQGLNYICNS